MKAIEEPSEELKKAAKQTIPNMNDLLGESGFENMMNMFTDPKHAETIEKMQKMFEGADPSNMDPSKMENLFKDSDLMNSPLMKAMTDTLKNIPKDKLDGMGLGEL